MSSNQNFILELEAIHSKLNQLNAAYVELKKSNNFDGQIETLKEGFLLKIRKSTEKILKYIALKEGITVTAKPVNGKIEETRLPMLNDYLFHLKGKKIIDSDIEHYLEIIKRWGNRNAHDISNQNIDSDLIKDSTIESVYDSFNYFTNWFFKKYTNGARVDFSKNIYSNSNKVNHLKEEERENILKNSKANPFNIPDFSILKESKQYKNIVRRKKLRLKWMLFFIISISIYLIFHFYFSGSKIENATEVVSHSKMTKDQVYDFLIKYYNTSNDKDFDAHQYFAKNIKQFITVKDINPTQVEVIRKTEVDYIDNKITIDKESLSEVPNIEGGTKWQFWCDYNCFRTSKQKFQSCKVLIEFEFDIESKITAIRELLVKDLHYTKKKPI